MSAKAIWGTLTMLLLPVGLMAQPADGRSNEYPGGPDMLSWISDASRTDPGRFGPSYQREVPDRGFGRHSLGVAASPYRYPYKRYAFSYQAYATGPATWTPGYSYPYGYASSWYPYSSWRGLGNEGAYPEAFPNYDYNVNSPIPSVYGAPIQAAPAYTTAFASTAPANTASAYSRATFTSRLTSLITVTAPAGADIYLEGTKMASGGEALHTFQTPPLSPGEPYRYHVRAAWRDADGQAVDQTQDVNFTAGAPVTVHFPAAPTTTRSMETTD